MLAGRVSPAHHPLSPDAANSYRTLQGQAAVLARFSASFAVLARHAVRAYERALSLGSEVAWREFVRTAAALAKQSTAFDPIVHFDAAETQAWRFFESIAIENADLLALDDRLVLA